MAMLELAVNGRLINLPANTLLGRNTGTGIVETIPQSKFATPTMLDQAIIDLVGGAPGALNTLIELAAALNNDANFAANITNSLASKAPIHSPNFTGLPLVNNSNIFTQNMGGGNPDNFGNGILGTDANIDGTLGGWHFLTFIRNNNVNYGCQLALCDTQSIVKYRAKSNGAWLSWNTIV